MSGPRQPEKAGGGGQNGAVEYQRINSLNLATYFTYLVQLLPNCQTAKQPQPAFLSVHLRLPPPPPPSPLSGFFSFPSSNHPPLRITSLSQRLIDPTTKPCTTTTTLKSGIMGKCPALPVSLPRKRQQYMRAYITRITRVQYPAGQGCSLPFCSPLPRSLGYSGLVLLPVLPSIPSTPSYILSSSSSPPSFPLLLTFALQSPLVPPPNEPGPFHPSHPSSFLLLSLPFHFPLIGFLVHLC